ncbi:MAG: bifunctional hydroxymethylpyrimidine kinase/phosphomethylpyrimidine kinase [Candidatus Fermentibacteraceae bacterium]|nr:bifunctional hydroxymethylpyrimidine kinase/phosphomethylpyrimidine kinase [Candidatus Fermentibacteraceae bacterium]
MIPDNNIENILESMQGKRVLVVGDLILDHYLDGKVERISPEAPVPIVSLEKKCERWVLGGAANVARNICSLGGIPVMAGVIGEDREGEILKRLLLDEGVDTCAVVSDPARPTTSKTRIIASGGHQVIRLDSEITDPISDSVALDILSGIEEISSQLDAVVLEDYNKGVLIPGLISRVISNSRSKGIPVAVDPKFINFFEFNGCTLFKPNRLEISRALGRVITTIDEAAAAGNEILERLSADAVLITLGEEGSVLCRKDLDPFHRPTAARHVFDVSGAGDTVIAVMALSLASGLPLEDGVRISVFAAAATCAEPGVYAVKPDDIVREVDRYSRQKNVDRR